MGNQYLYIVLTKTNTTMSRLIQIFKNDRYTQEILAAWVLGSSNIIIPWWSWGIIVIFAVYIVKNSDTIEEKLISVIKSLLIKS